MTLLQWYVEGKKTPSPAVINKVPRKKKVLKCWCCSPALFLCLPRLFFAFFPLVSLLFMRISVWINLSLVFQPLIHTPMTEDGKRTGTLRWPVGWGLTLTWCLTLVFLFLFLNKYFSEKCHKKITSFFLLSVVFFGSKVTTVSIVTGRTAVVDLLSSVYKGGPWFSFSLVAPPPSYFLYIHCTSMLLRWHTLDIDILLLMESTIIKITVCI